jgi:hypothetical protein
MIKEEIAPGIIVYSDVIPDSKNLYNDIEEGLASAGLSWNEARVKSGVGEDSMKNPKIRDTQTVGVQYLGGVVELEATNFSDAFFTNLNNIFFQHFDPLEKDYESSFGVVHEWHDMYGILKYGKGQHFLNHIDDHPSYHRRMSTVYYLNDNYTGGEINFPRFDITFKPKANQMIIFPSTYVYNHSVSEVVDGTRYAVVSWMK